MKNKKLVDPIMMEIINNYLLSFTEQAGISLVNCAFSPTIKERRDCSNGLLDFQGRVITQASHIPIHFGSMIDIGKTILDKFGSKNIFPGDVFIDNDPYWGGSSHLSDITIITPIFFEGELEFFAVNTAHHVDIGGRVPGSTSPDNLSIFEEGIRIPPIKLIKKRNMDQDVLELISYNCRDPKERIADIKAQIASNYVMKKPVENLFLKYGQKMIRQAVIEIFEYAKRRFKARIKEMEDGIYKAEGFLDSDGVSMDPVRIKVEIKIKGDKINLDFTGTDPQAKGAVNVVRQALLSGVYFSLKSIFDPTIPVNDGFFRTIDVFAPKGCLLNPYPNAAVGVRLDSVQRLVDVIVKALSRMIPEKRAIAGSCATGSAYVLYGKDSKRKKNYVHVEVIGGGGGARSNKNGLDGIQVYSTNTSNLPVEVLETEYPLVVEKYALIRSSAGVGKFRGGMGIRRDIRVLEDAGLTTRVEGTKSFPWGIYGGKNASPAKVVLNPDTSQEIAIPSRKGNIPLHSGDVVSIQTPGGGGFGKK